MIEILAVLSVSAAAGMRIALPLLVFGLLQEGNLWSQIPILSQFPEALLIGLLSIWSLFELFASKKLLGQRILQVVQLMFSPLVGAILGLAILTTPMIPNWLIASIAALLALVLQIVQVGWFYRLRGLPLWAVLIQDILCVALVLFAVDAPWHGGLIALMLLWFAVRSATQWYSWYQKGKKTKVPRRLYL